MDFAFSEEQELLRAAARDYLADRWPSDRVVTTADGEPSFDARTWRELADLGWLDPALGLLEHAVLAEETGFALLPAPWFSTTALAGPVLDGPLHDGVAAGERAVTLAWAEPASWTLRGQRSAVHADGDRLTGTKVPVPDLASVTDVVVVAADGLYAVDLVEHPEVVVALSTTDRTRRRGGSTPVSAPWTTYAGEPWHWRPARRWVSPNAPWISRPSTRRPASSSGGSSGATRACRTGWPTSTSPCS
jgi:alkylation response protein AidB-like acyl-CoA dehydrogenase